MFPLLDSLSERPPTMVLRQIPHPQKRYRISGRERMIRAMEEAGWIPAKEFALNARYSRIGLVIHAHRSLLRRASLPSSCFPSPCEPRRTVDHR